MADEVTVQRIGVSPNNCALEEPITLEMDFTVPRDLDHALWRLRFIADTAGCRKIVELGTTDITHYNVGPASMRFHVDSVNVSHLKRHVLSNVGLFTATLLAGEEEIVQVSMVVQVTPDTSGQLFRSIYNPLE